MRRHVAQPGSAPSWGVGGRRFKSSRADQNHIENQPLMAGFLCLNFVRGIIGENGGITPDIYTLHYRRFIFFNLDKRMCKNAVHRNIIQGFSFDRLTLFRYQCLTQ